MSVFQSAEQFYVVMQEVFDYVMEHPEHVDSFMHSNLVVRMTTTNPDAEIVLDGRQPPLGVFLGSRPGRANLEVSLDADLLHALWMGVESTHQAFFSGRIQTRGNLLKAMQLIEVFLAAERIYPTIARRYGLVDVAGESD
ncbi:MAG: SCP2 sterol-binding domain-containing protein [Caldilinea sp.]